MATVPDIETKEIEKLRRKVDAGELLYTTALEMGAPIEVVAPIGEYVNECRQLIKIWRD